MRLQFLAHGAAWQVALPASVAIAIGNTAEALAARWIMQRFASSDGAFSLQRTFVLVAALHAVTTTQEA